MNVLSKVLGKIPALEFFLLATLPRNMLGKVPGKIIGIKIFGPEGPIFFYPSLISSEKMIVAWHDYLYLKSFARRADFLTLSIIM